MSKIKFPILGRIKVPFETLINNPTLVLEKFPMIDTLEAVGPMNYFVETIPFSLTAMIKLRRRWHINLEVGEGKLIWAPVPDEHEADGCDGWIHGEITALPNGYCKVDLHAVMEHRLLNVITSAVYKNAIHSMGARFMSAFEANFNNAEFKNVVPVFTP